MKRFFVTSFILVTMPIWGSASVRAHDFTGGVHASSVVLKSGFDHQGWHEIVGVRFDSGDDHLHHCVVTVNADVGKPSTQAQHSQDFQPVDSEVWTEYDRYKFELKFDDVPEPKSRRLVAFQYANQVPAGHYIGPLGSYYTAVSVTYFFPDIEPGEHTITWMGILDRYYYPDVEVTNASLTLVCTKNRRGVPKGESLNIELIGTILTDF